MPISARPMAACAQRRPAYMDARLCMLRRIGIQDVLRGIEAFRQPRYSRRALQTTLHAIQHMDWGLEGPWVSYAHFPGVQVGHFTVTQCPQCHRVTQFRHVHGPSSLSYTHGCAC